MGKFNAVICVNQTPEINAAISKKDESIINIAKDIILESIGKQHNINHVNFAIKTDNNHLIEGDDNIIFKAMFECMNCNCMYLFTYDDVGVSIFLDHEFSTSDCNEVILCKTLG